MGGVEQDRRFESAVRELRDTGEVGGEPDSGGASVPGGLQGLAVTAPRLFAVEAWREEVAPEPLSYSVLGRIAELKAEVRLLELGHKVARPGLDDDGVDLVVDHRLAVQVKSTGGLKGFDGSSARRWEFEFRTARKDGRRAASNGARSRGRSHVDFLLLYGRDADVWWVVPTVEIPVGPRGSYLSGWPKRRGVARGVAFALPGFQEGR